jgi:hypothetical protein
MLPHPIPLPAVLMDILTGYNAQHQTVQKLTVYYPTVGRKDRPFQSLGDAAAYEAGYRAFDPRTAGPQITTPYSRGWWDAAAKYDGLDEVAA